MLLAILFESVGAGEWLVLLAVLLIVVGPQRLPATARKFGQYYSKFRRAAEGFKRQLLDMDTEFTQAVQNAENEVNEAAKAVDPDLAPPDPSEYGGYDENYAEYGGVRPEAGAPEEPAAPPVEEPKPTLAAAPKPKDGIKITVSPAPTAPETKKTEA